MLLGSAGSRRNVALRPSLTRCRSALHVAATVAALVLVLLVFARLMTFVERLAGFIAGRPDYDTLFEEAKRRELKRPSDRVRQACASSVVAPSYVHEPEQIMESLGVLVDSIERVDANYLRDYRNGNNYGRRRHRAPSRPDRMAATQTTSEEANRESGRGDSRDEVCMFLPVNGLDDGHNAEAFAAVEDILSQAKADKARKSSGGTSDPGANPIPPSPTDDGDIATHGAKTNVSSSPPRPERMPIHVVVYSLSRLVALNLARRFAHVSRASHGADVTIALALDTTEWSNGHARRIMVSRRLCERHHGSRDSFLNRGELSLPLFYWMYQLSLWTSTPVRGHALAAAGRRLLPNDTMATRLARCAWFAKVDTDVAFNMPLLMRQLMGLGSGVARRSYVGTPVTIDMERFLHRAYRDDVVDAVTGLSLPRILRVTYHLGGPSYMLSRAALRAMDINLCFRAMAVEPIWLIHDDVAVGYCVALLGGALEAHNNGSDTGPQQYGMQQQRGSRSRSPLPSASTNKAWSGQGGHILLTPPPVPRAIDVDVVPQWSVIAATSEYGALSVVQRALSIPSARSCLGRWQAVHPISIEARRFFRRVRDAERNQSLAQNSPPTGDMVIAQQSGMHSVRATDDAWLKKIADCGAVLIAGQPRRIGALIRRPQDGVDRVPWGDDGISRHGSSEGRMHQGGRRHQRRDDIADIHAAVAAQQHLVPDGGLLQVSGQPKWDTLNLDGLF